MPDLAVIGLGYVGLPLVQEACAQGLEVVGLDVSPSLVERLNAGESHIDDIPDAAVQSMIASGFVATSDSSVLARCATIVICVPTPLSQEGGPDLAAVQSASIAIADNLTRGTLVVLESTTWPGTTEDVVRPILESSGLVAGVDFHLAFSPERIDPGNSSFGLRNTPKVVGGLTPHCAQVATEFYERVVDDVVVASGPKEAEMAKLLENTYRHVNIALVNEMAKFSHELGIDIWDVIKCAATKPFGFQSFTPGPGVGGHCIPIDPNYLSFRVKASLGYPFRFVELAQEINHSMPRYVVDRAADMLNDIGKPLRGSKILILGVTYKAGIADQRESPALPIGRLLLDKGADISHWDPFVEAWHCNGRTLTRPDSLEVALAEADVALHLQPHTSYSSEVLARSETPVLDARGSLSGELVRRL